MIFLRDTLIILGAGGHGKVVAEIALLSGKWSKVFFLDDDTSIKENLGLKVIGKLEDIYRYKEADFFVAIGKNETRKKIQEKLIEEGFSIVTLIHPTAVIGKDVKIDIGTVVMAGAVINASTKIGKGCIINTGAIVEHDNEIGDYVHISPGARLGGTVKIGVESWIGIGATVINNVNICAGCIIGAGAIVVKDITEPGTYVGVPVRKIK